MLPSLAVRGDATHALPRKCPAVTVTRCASGSRRARSLGRGFVVVVDLPRQRRRAPEFCASINGWPKTPEPESLCVAGLQLRKHQPKSADLRVRPEPAPFITDCGYYSATLKFGKQNSMFPPHAVRKPLPSKVLRTLLRYLRGPSARTIRLRLILHRVLLSLYMTMI